MFVQANSMTIGPTESLPAIKQQGYGWVAGNVATGEWADERRIAKANGLDFLPWRRVRNTTDLDTLVQARKRWSSQAIIPNVEIEDTRVPALMAKILVEMSRAGKALVVTDGWADPIGCWQGYRKWVGAVECFPQQNPAFWDVNGCVLHAGAFFRAVVPVLGAYSMPSGVLPTRSSYSKQEFDPIIVYPGDSVEDWRKW